MRRVLQIWLIGAMLAFSWLAMMAVHETGHVIHAWVSGGKVVAVKLPWMGFSVTEVAPNPHPLLVAWGGAVWGCVIPVVLDQVARWLRWRWRYLARFLAGFCLIANGAYLGAGWIVKAGDAGDLVRYGTPVWMMIAFGVVGVVMGLVYWNGLGAHFGLGAMKGRVEGRDAALVTVLAAALMAAQAMLLA